MALRQEQIAPCSNSWRRRKYKPGVLLQSPRLYVCVDQIIDLAKKTDIVIALFAASKFHLLYRYVILWSQIVNRKEILDRARRRQGSETLEEAKGAAGRELRIILEFDHRKEPGDVVAQIRGQLGLNVTATFLFAPPDGEEPDSALQGFIAVTVTSVDIDAIDGQAFELAYAIGDATGAVTAEPELVTNFYVEPPGNLESAGDILDCWTPENEDIAATRPEWAIDRIKARKAWNIPPKDGGASRGQGVRVFQPDTGVANHIELEPDAIDFARAYDFVDNKPGATDPLNYSGNPGHGTGTASVVASREAGKIAGSAPLATLVPVRAIKDVVVILYGAVAAAVEHARRNGANVITMSLGGAWSSALRAAINRAIADGVIVLAAGGNCVKVVVWPARYEEVIAVAGTNIRDQPWRGTCSGDAIDISAPAEFVPRAKRNPADGGGPKVVAGGQGTSFAVAITAGVAALWVGHHTATRVKAAAQGGSVQNLFVSLLQATSWRPAGFDTASMGAGIVNAEALLNHPLAHPEAIAAAAPADPYRSLRTLIAETGGAEEAVAALDQRRFAAELSHLALTRARAARTRHPERAQAEGGKTPVSPTLRDAVSATGAKGLEHLIGP